MAAAVVVVALLGLWAIWLAELGFGGGGLRRFKGNRIEINFDFFLLLLIL